MQFSIFSSCAVGIDWEGDVASFFHTVVSNTVSANLITCLVCFLRVMQEETALLFLYWLITLEKMRTWVSLYVGTLWPILSKNSWELACEYSRLHSISKNCSLRKLKKRAKQFQTFFRFKGIPRRESNYLRFINKRLNLLEMVTK